MLPLNDINSYPCLKLLLYRTTQQQEALNDPSKEFMSRLLDDLNKYNQGVVDSKEKFRMADKIIKMINDDIIDTSQVEVKSIIEALLKKSAILRSKHKCIDVLNLAVDAKRMNKEEVSQRLAEYLYKEVFELFPEFLLFPRTEDLIERERTSEDLIFECNRNNFDCFLSFLRQGEFFNVSRLILSQKVDFIFERYKRERCQHIQINEGKSIDVEMNNPCIFEHTENRFMQSYDSDSQLSTQLNSHYAFHARDETGIKEELPRPVGEFNGKRGSELNDFSAHFSEKSDLFPNTEFSFDDDPPSEEKIEGGGLRIPEPSLRGSNQSKFNDSRSYNNRTRNRRTVRHSPMYKMPELKLRPFKNKEDDEENEEEGVDESVVLTTTTTVVYPSTQSNESRSAKFPILVFDEGDDFGATRKEIDGSTKLKSGSKVSRLAPNKGNEESRILHFNEKTPEYTYKYVYTYKDKFPLHCAAKSNEYSKVQELNELYPGIIHQLDDSGKTPIMVACANNSFETALLLLRLGADSTLVDNKKRSALIYLMKCKAQIKKGNRQAFIHQENLFKALVSKLKKFELFEIDLKGKSALDWAIITRKEKYARRLIGRIGSYNQELFIKTINCCAKYKLYHLNTFFKFLLKKLEHCEDHVKEQLFKIAYDNENPFIICHLVKEGFDFLKKITVNYPISSENNIKRIIFKYCDNLGRTPLLIACAHRDFELALKLLDGGADYRNKDKKGYTALIYLMKSEIPERRRDECMKAFNKLFERLIDADNIFNADEKGSNALCWAIYSGKEDYAIKLVDIINKNFQLAHFRQALEMACKYNAINLVIHMLKKEYLDLKDYGSRLFEIALNRENHDIIRVLSEFGFDIKIKIRDFCETDDYKSLSSILNKKIAYCKIIEEAFENNILNFKDHGSKIFKAALESLNLDVIRTLIKIGLDINKYAEFFCNENRFDVLNFFIFHQLISPDLLINNIPLIHWILAKCHDFNDKDHILFKLSEEIVDKITDVNIRNGDGYTLLHAAVWANHPNLVVKLLAKGARIDEKVGAGGLTPLAFATVFGFHEIAGILNRHEESLRHGYLANND